jgi:hypothetical protein
LAFFFAGPVCDCPRPCFFFFRGFFDMTLLLYRVPRNQRPIPRVDTVDEWHIEEDPWESEGGKSEIRNPKFRQGEELPRGSLDPGGNFEKVGIMVGVKGRYKLVGGRKPADTRWACRRPQKPSGLPRQETSREKGSITTWRNTYMQNTCLKIVLKTRSRCAQVAQLRVTMSGFGNVTR